MGPIKTQGALKRRELRRRFNIHSSRKNGTMYLLQDLTREWLHWPHATRLPVKRSLPIVWEVVFSPFRLQTATIKTKRMHGENWSSKLMRLKDLTATLTSMEWTLPEIELAQWLRNGTLSLRLSYKPKPLMDTSLECSALPSPRKHTSK